MKIFLILVLLFSESDTAHFQEMVAYNASGSPRVSFTAIIDIRNATKDGIYVGGYVVNIPYDKILKLNGKTVRISGKVTIVKGISNAYEQGREVDTKHILKPKIRVLDN